MANSYIDNAIEEIEEKIAKLQQAKNALYEVAGMSTEAQTGRPRFKTAIRPLGSVKKRTMSPEAREKIAEAQRLRWAAARNPVKAAPVNKKVVAPKARKKGPASVSPLRVETTAQEPEVEKE